MRAAVNHGTLDDTQETKYSRCYQQTTFTGGKRGQRDVSAAMRRRELAFAAGPYTDRQRRELLNQPSRPRGQMKSVLRNVFTNPTVVWARLKLSIWQAVFMKYTTSLHCCHIKRIQGGYEKLASFCPPCKSGHRIHTKAPLISSRHPRNDCRIS